MLYVINKIKSNSDNYSIKITYSDNVVINATFSDILNQGVMTVLKNPTVFNQVEIGKRGRSIIWKQYDIDFCADALRFKFENITNQLTNSSELVETQTL